MEGTRLDFLCWNGWMGGGGGKGRYMRVTQQWTFMNFGLITLIFSPSSKILFSSFCFRDLHSCIFMRVRMFVVVYLFVNPARKSLIALAIVAITLAAWASLGGPRGGS